jgi:ketosteroid isomerase-like protein
MHDAHTQLIERFYAAFAARDADAMAACCHTDIHFTDATFDLRGHKVRLMRKMLCAAQRDLRIEVRDLYANESWGSAQCDARYTFPDTGRTVRTRVDAEFAFRDGLIARHIDSVDFWAWSRQALGAPGWLLGWSDTLRTKVRVQASQRLATFADN